MQQLKTNCRELQHLVFLTTATRQASAFCFGLQQKLLEKIIAALYLCLKYLRNWHYFKQQVNMPGNTKKAW